MDMIVNGKTVTVAAGVADDDAMLIDVLRNAGLTGTSSFAAPAFAVPARCSSTASRW